MSSRLRIQDPAIHALGLIAPPPLHIECEAFQGSLSLMFDCVRAHKVDLREIPLYPICAAYIEYLMGQQEAELESSAAALTALAYFLERKAFDLLPSTEPEPEIEDAPEPLEPTAHLYQPIVEELRERESNSCTIFCRNGGQSAYELPFDLTDVSAFDLGRVLQKLLNKANPTVNPLGKPRRSLIEQMKVVLAALTVEPRSLDALIEEPFDRIEAVWWFLALLELIKLRQVKIINSEETMEFAKVGVLDL